VPIAGTGTVEDPHRPLLIPAPGTTVSGLISWSWELSDDGKLAIVEFVARDKSVLRPVTTNTRVVRSFEKGKDKQEDIEREVRKYKKDYRLNKGVGARAE
jgi:hypothetical protein